MEGKCLLFKHFAGVDAIPIVLDCHNPDQIVETIEITKRSKVRRNYLTYMRQRTGKAARLSSLDFDKVKVNKVADEIIETNKDNKE